MRQAAVTERPTSGPLTAVTPTESVEPSNLDSGDVTGSDDVDVASAARHIEQPDPAPAVDPAPASGGGDRATAAVTGYSALAPSAAAHPAPARVVSKFFALLGIGSSAGGGGGAQLPSIEFVTAALAPFRREIDRLFTNHGPTAAVTLAGQSDPRCRRRLAECR